MERVCLSCEGPLHGGKRIDDHGVEILSDEKSYRVFIGGIDDPIVPYGTRLD